MSGDQLPAAITAASLSMRPFDVWTQAPVAALPTCVTVAVSNTTPSRVAGSDERAHQRVGHHVAVRGDEQRAVHARREIGLDLAHFVLVEQAVHHARLRQLARQRGQADGFRVGGGHLQRAAADVLHLEAGVGGDTLDEVVVQRQAANAELQEGGDVAFDVGGEDTGRRACGALARRAGVGHVNPRPPPRELVCDGAAHDACADHRDFHGWSILLVTRMGES